ncbi:MAG: hypothetical protein M1818_001289 [Claussenomyces sp. TS43310]|nr:MAG: hypothetical protein M1818_001289 [Claussenomyces sp. TS43310]
MRIVQNSVLTVVSLAIIAEALSGRAALISTSDFSSSDIIYRDVCIVGGGASGTYGAIRLHDMGKSIVIVERNPVLGGQTETYTDPVSNNKTEMGVVAWYDIVIVNNFFNRLNVTLATTDVARAGSAALTTLPVDFRTGKVVTNVFSGNVTEGLVNYATQLAKYPYLEDGFDLPYPVPADLLLPFGDFIKKYKISGAVQTLNIFGNGMGNFLEQTTLYVFKLVSMATIQALEQGTFQATADHKNDQVYINAQAELGDNVLLSSRVVDVDRSDSPVKVVVKTPSGLKLIIAKKLLLSIPPKLDNLVGFDLDPNEVSAFSQITSAGYYTAVINNTGIDGHIEVRNFGADSPYNVPVLPGPYFVQASAITGLFTVKYCTPHPVGDASAKASIIANVQRLRSAGTLNTTTPEFVAFHSHAPFSMTVSVEAIQDGFYKNLSALQGYKETYWTGAAFHTQDSSKLWQFTEKLLPTITDRL